MQQHSPIEIKQRLLKALDKEYNVVDMGTVLEIVTILERTPITKEALESTRLGRDINELRRKTKNESLAKRAKDLVRRWRDLIIPPTDSGGGTVASVGPGVTGDTTQLHHQNGSTRPFSRNHPGTTSSVTSATPVVKSIQVSPAISLPISDTRSISPALSASRLDPVPKTHAANKRLRKEVSCSPPLPVTASASNSSSGKPPLKKSKKDDKAVLHTSIRESPSAADISTSVSPALATTTTVEGSKRRLNGDHYTDSFGSDCEIVSVTPAQPKLKCKSRQKKAPKDRTKKSREDDDIVKEKIASIARLHKVKTTQELLAGLQSRTGENCSIPQSANRGSPHNAVETLPRTQRINVEDEDAESEDTVDVEGASDSDSCDSDTRDGLKSRKIKDIGIHEQSSVDLEDEEVSEKPDTKQLSEEKQPPLATPEEILAKLPPLDLNLIRWDEDEIVNKGSSSNLLSSSNSSRLSQEESSVTEDDVNRVLSEPLNGINGNYEILPDGSSVFRQWHQMLTTPSTSETELLHILPYVVID